MTFLALRSELLTFTRECFSYRSLLNVVFNILYTRLFLNGFFYETSQPSFVFLQSETDSNNKRDKTKPYKHQRREGE